MPRREEASAISVHFDLIHAHFVYPDGVVAAKLGRELGIPVVTTEHSHWIPWMGDLPSTWQQVETALPYIHTVTAVSTAVADGIRGLVGTRVRVEVLPNVLDDAVVSLQPGGGGFDPDRILFAGVIRRVKGFDVLLEALSCRRDPVQNSNNVSPITITRYTVHMSLKNPDIALI